MIEYYCFSCGNKFTQEGTTVSRRETCSVCASFCRCCRNCKFYSPDNAHECREPSAELVREKENANYCDFFVVSTTKPSNTSGRDDKKTDARKKLDELF